MWTAADEEVLADAVESSDERNDNGERSSHDSEEESISEEEDLLEDKNDDEDPVEEEEDMFHPLVENQFTISIRKLPLPPTLISFLLYYRQ